MINSLEYQFALHQWFEAMKAKHKWDNIDSYPLNFENKDDYFLMDKSLVDDLVYWTQRLDEVEDLHAITDS